MDTVFTFYLLRVGSTWPELSFPPPDTIPNLRKFEHLQSFSMESHDLIDNILSIFKERDLPVNPDSITSALEDPATGSKNAEWLAKHLHPDTLLSREELTLCANPAAELAL